MTAIRRGPWAGVALFLGFWALLLVGGRSAFLRDPGTFWHTVVGEKILTEGFFDTDPFTFTFTGQRWIPHQWLGEVTMAVLHRVGGLDALLIASSGILAGLYAWLTVRVLRTGMHVILAIAFVVLALAASSSHFHIRPHLATIIGVAVTTAALLDVDSRSVRLGRLGWLVPMYLLWSNTHGGALGGLAMLGLTGAGWTVFRVIGRPSPVTSIRDVVLLGGMGLGCGLAALVTPYGADIARTWLDIMNAPHLPDIIREHARTDFSDPTTWPVVALAGVYLFVIFGVKIRDWRVSWLLPLFWMFQAYSRVRHAPLFAVVATLVVADVWSQTRWATWLALRRPDVYDPAGRLVCWGWVGTVVVVVLVAAALIVPAVGGAPPLVGRSWAKLDPEYWPTELTDTLHEYEPTGVSGRRLFNDYIDGGFVIYHAPGYRVFVDDRCELFGDDWLVRFVEAGAAEPTQQMAAWQREYGQFDFALTRTGTWFNEYFRDRPVEWECLRATPTAAFYRRK